MNFPFSYTGELVFYKPEEFNTQHFVEQIKDKVNLLNTKGERITFTDSISYSKLPIKINLTVHDDNTSIHCRYKISLLENNIALLFSIVFANFFFYFQSTFLALTVLVLGVVFYTLNAAKISRNIKALIYTVIGINSDFDTSELWHQQQQWMKDKNLCPACGELKNNHSNICVNCGLYFSTKKPNIDQVNISSLQKTELNYKITKKKE
ncbi:MAG: hypothetical protein PF517_20055 [Salinivirgaceae bacterium]|jgi:ribosomal protein L32|nr:hypothetical protein [Salinivirgaceae bacterium]